MKRGFTLIETIIYIGLLSLIMSGVLVSAYGLIEASGRDDGALARSEEADFIMHKLAWALDGVAIDAPAIGTTGQVLKLEKAGVNLTFVLDHGRVMLLSGAAPAAPLNSSAAPVELFTVTHMAATRLMPEGVIVRFKMSGADYSIVKYLP